MAVFVLLSLAITAGVWTFTAPFDPAQPAWSLRMPLFVLIFAFLIAGVLLGGFAAWLRQGRHRRASRALRSDLVGLRREIEILNSRMEPQGETRAAARRSRSVAAARDVTCALLPPTTWPGS